MAGEAGAWSLQGVRPANHPRVRLRQYAGWTQRRRDWPVRLAALGDHLPAGQSCADADTVEYRRRHGLAGLRRRLADELCADAVAGTRFDNLCSDGFLPLLAARTGGELGGLWFHWRAGDMPAPWLRALRELGVSGRRNAPACHGTAQGLLGWLIEREGREGPAQAAAADG